MNQKYIYVISLAAIFISCNIPAKENKKEDNFITSTNSLELDKRFYEVDSLVFVFYKDPFGEDSLRYSRYFTQTSTKDSNDISLLLHNLSVKYTKFEKVKNCRNEGKVWCYSKGHIFQTVYFSNYCSKGPFLYMIKDGFFFYVDLEKSLADRITALKSISIEPETH